MEKEERPRMGRPKKKEIVDEAENNAEKPRMGRPKEEEVVKEAQKKVHSQSYRFFKVYLSSHSSTKLSIPQSAVPYFNRIITKPRVVVLKNHVGGKFTCKMEPVKGGVAIKDGWHRFAQQNSLEDGDFLTFSHSEESRFDVDVYSVYGVLKKVSEISNTTLTEATESEEEEEEEEEEQEESVAEEETCEEPDDSSSMHNSSGLSPTTKTTPKRKPPERILEEQRGSPSSSGSTFLQNPHFWVDVTATTINALHVARKVVKLHGIELQPNVMLCDEQGKKWPVKVCPRQDGRIAFTKGWAVFYRKKNLKPQDRCIFEFVTVFGEKTEKVKVQIIRSDLAT